MPVLRIKQNGVWEEISGFSDHTHSGYASIDHTHSEYASISNVESMIDSVSNNSVKYSDLSNYQVKHTVATVTLYKNKWSNNTQTVSINNATATNTVIVGSLPNNHTEYAECGIRCVSQGKGTLTFTCDNVPSINIQANVIFME